MKKYLGIALFTLIFSGSASAVDFGIGAKAGINGIGLDLSVGLTKNLNLRVSASSIDIDDEEETVTVGDDGFEGDIDAELELDFGSNAVMLDWHVLGGGFRLTAGMFRHTGSADLGGVLQSQVRIDGQVLDPSDLVGGEIGGKVELADSYQPYVGIGWGRGAEETVLRQSIAQERSLSAKETRELNPG